MNRTPGENGIAGAAHNFSSAVTGRRSWRAILTAGAVLTVAVAVAPLSARAVDVRLTPPGRAGWEPMLLPRVERRSVYVPVEEGGVAAVRAESQCSASGLLLPVEDIDLAETPRLRWRWRIERGLPSRDERVRKGDDFAARVYVLFRFERERAGLWERVQNRIGRAFYGRNVPGKAITYVWSASEERGAAWTNPFTSSSWMISLGKGALPSWRQEEVDVRAEYRSRFGEEPPPVVAVALMTDSDNVCEEAVAYFADFRFVSSTKPVSGAR